MKLVAAQHRSGAKESQATLYLIGNCHFVNAFGAKNLASEIKGEENEMYRLTVEQSFDSAHFLAGYLGKCGNIHGHRWRVLIQVASETLHTDGQERGMCVDFSTLKEELKELADIYDHTLLIEKGTLKEKTMEALHEEGFAVVELAFRPTAENFAKHFYDLFAEKGYDVAMVQVYETPNNCASYGEAQ
jgi:6-pyruvoyltetrahydropterin/6-carboxytetrahydropterin synthase